MLAAFEGDVVFLFIFCRLFSITFLSGKSFFVVFCPFTRTVEDAGPYKIEFFKKQLFALDLNVASDVALLSSGSTPKTIFNRFLRSR